MTQGDVTEREGRDLLGHAFFYHHLLVVGFVVLGWLAPWKAVLVFYLTLLPAMALQWQFNKDSCVLNNVESLIRTGRWRNPDNREEGAFLLEIVRSQINPHITRDQMNAAIYLAVAVFWGLALGHLVQR